MTVPCNIVMSALKTQSKNYSITVRVLGSLGGERIVDSDVVLLRYLITNYPLSGLDTSIPYCTFKLLRLH